jgi:hypothetical protein
MKNNAKQATFPGFVLPTFGDYEKIALKDYENKPTAFVVLSKKDVETKFGNSQACKVLIFTDKLMGIAVGFQAMFRNAKIGVWYAGIVRKDGLKWKMDPLNPTQQSTLTKRLPDAQKMMAEHDTFNDGFGQVDEDQISL